MVEIIENVRGQESFIIQPTAHLQYHLMKFGDGDALRRSSASVLQR